MWVTRNLHTDKLNCNFFIFSNVKSIVLNCCRSVFGKVQMSDVFFKPSFIVWKNNTVGCFYLWWQSFKPYHLLVMFCEGDFHSSSIARCSCRTLKEHNICILWHDCFEKCYFIYIVFTFNWIVFVVWWGSEQSSPREINRVQFHGIDESSEMGEWTEFTWWNKQGLVSRIRCFSEENKLRA